MKSRTLLVLIASLLFLFLSTQGALATPIPDGEISITPFEAFFLIDGGTATVTSWVYEYSESPYVYAYQITNHSTTELSFFSVGILPGGDASDPRYDAPGGTVIPSYWSLMGSPVQSVNAEFNTIGNGESSAILWFSSNSPFDFGEGVLIGWAAGGPEVATGSLLTSAPEPATILLLGIGGAFLTASRKRRLF